MEVFDIFLFEKNHRHFEYLKVSLFMCWFGILSKIYVAPFELIGLEYTKFNRKTLKKIANFD